MARLTRFGDFLTSLRSVKHRGVEREVERERESVCVCACVSLTPIVHPQHNCTALCSVAQMNVDAADGNGDTALLEAASGGDMAAVNFLLSRGAYVNARGRFDRSPLYRAAFAGHVDVVRALLEAGADPRLYDSEGITPVEVRWRSDRV